MFSDKLLKIIKTLIYCLALTPLIITPMTIFPFNFGRGLIMQFLIEIIFGLYLVLAIFDKNYRPRKNLINIAFGIFILISFIASLAGVDFNKSFWGDECRFTGWLYLAHIFAILIVLQNIFNKKDWNKFLSANILVAVLMFGIAALSLFGVKFWGVDLGTRISGTLGNPIFLAAYFILNLIFAFYLFFTIDNNYRYFFAIPAFILLWGVIMAQSRGAILGLCGGFIAAISYFIIFSKSKKLRLYAMGIFIALLILISALFALQGIPIVSRAVPLHRIKELSLSAPTASTRFIMWKIAWNAFRERPLLGWGAENFNIAFNKYYQPKLLGYSYYETWSDKPHNAILGIMADTGVMGLLSYVSIFFGAICLIYKRQKEKIFNIGAGAALFGGMAAYFTQNLFAFDTPVSYLCLGFLLALIGASPERGGEKPKAPLIFIGATQASEMEKQSFSISEPRSQYRLIPRALGAGAYILLAASIGFCIAWFLSASPLYADIKLRQNTLFYEYTQKIDLDGYKRNMKYFNPYKEEWRVDLAKAVVLSLKKADNMYSAEEAKFAAGEIEKNIKEHPENSYYYLMAGALEGELIPYSHEYAESSKKLLDKALELSPERQHIYFAYGRVYGLEKDKEKLIDSFNKAIQLAPDAALSYWEAGKQLYLLDNNDPLAKKWIEEAIELGFFPEDDGELLFILKNFYNYYLKNKKYDTLSGFFERMERIEPQEAKWPAQRAAALYLSGDKDGALQEIKKAVELDGSYKAEGEKFIRMIETGE